MAPSGRCLPSPEAGSSSCPPPRGEQGFFYETWAKRTGWQKIEVLWQHCPRIDPAFIDEERRERGSAWASQEYECQFIAAGATRIQRSWLRYEDRAPAGLNIALGIDLAISEKETADYTAGAVLGRDMAGSLHVLEVFPIGAHDDMVDRLAYAWQALGQIPQETRLVFPGATKKPAWK